MNRDYAQAMGSQPAQKDLDSDMRSYNESRDAMRAEATGINSRPAATGKAPKTYHQAAGIMSGAVKSLIDTVEGLEAQLGETGLLRPEEDAAKRIPSRCPTSSRTAAALEEHAAVIQICVARIQALQGRLDI